MQFSTGEALSALIAIIALGGHAWGVIRWTQGQIAAVRTEAQADIKAVRIEAQADIQRAQTALDVVRAECARREDLSGIQAQLSGISARLDGGLNNIGRRIDDLMRPGTARGAD